jgi:hypothetical protein
MAETHVISALVSKHSELQGSIKYHQEIVSKLKLELETIDKAIAIFDPSYKTMFIQAKRVTNAPYFARGELTKKIIEFLKTKQGSIDEVADFVFGKDELSKYKHKQSVYALMNRLVRRGILYSFTDNGVKFYKIAAS